MATDDFIPFMSTHWLQIADGAVTVGISDEGLEEITEITKVALPAEGEAVSADEICGEIETDEGPLNIYSPVDGKIIELNSAILENPDVINDDPYGDGWLFRIEPTNADDLDDLAAGGADDDDDDLDDDDEEEEEED